MIRFLLVSCSLIALGQTLDLNTKLSDIFRNMDLIPDGMVIISEVYGYFQEYKEDPSHSYITCEYFHPQWALRYKDTLDISKKICTDYFDHDKDSSLDGGDLDALYHDIDDGDERIVYDEFDVYFRKMYNELGIHS